MSLEFRQLDESTRSDFAELLRNAHGQAYSDAFYERYLDWRFFARGDSETLLAYVKDQCVATIDSQVRPYVMGGKVFRVRETSEWYCVEKFRPLGVGIHIVKELMSRPEPLLSVRGTEVNQALLPQLNWHTLAPVASYELMLNWRWQVRKVRDSLKGVVAGRSSRPPLHVSDAGPNIQKCNSMILAASENTGLAPQILDWEPAWINSAPSEIGRFLWLEFHRDNVFNGFALCREYNSGGYHRGQIIAMEAQGHDAATYTEMIPACVAALQQRGVVRIRTRTSAAPVQSALSKCHFELEEQQPAFWWPGQHASVPNTPNHLMFLRGDDYIRPFDIA